MAAYTAGTKWNMKLRKIEATENHRAVRPHGNASQFELVLGSCCVAYLVVCTNYLVQKLG